MRIVAEGQQLVRVDWDANNLTDQNLNQVLKQVLKNKDVDGVIISDYNKGICTELVIKDIINKAKELQIPIFVDPKGKKWNKYYGASVITPNLKEAEEALGRRLIENDEDVETAGMEICNDLSLDACLITRGPNGMSYIGKDVNFHVSSEAKEIYDVSGAGDTVIASFAAGTVGRI